MVEWQCSFAGYVQVNKAWENTWARIQSFSKGAQQNKWKDIAAAWKFEPNVNRKVHDNIS